MSLLARTLGVLRTLLRRSRSHRGASVSHAAPPTPPERAGDEAPVVRVVFDDGTVRALDVGGSTRARLDHLASSLLPLHAPDAAQTRNTRSGHGVDLP